MRRRCLKLLLASLPLLIVASPLPAIAQVQPPIDLLQVRGSDATTWREGRTNVLMIQGPVTIDMDRTKLTAQSAIIWLTPTRTAVIEAQQAEIVLIGDASIEQDGVVRTGPSIYVNGIVRGNIRVVASDRRDVDRSTSDLYRRANALRPGAAPEAPSVMGASTRPSTPPILGPRVLSPAAFQFQNVETIKTDEGKVAAVLSGGVLVIYRGDDGSSLEFQGDRAVVFTTLRSLGGAGDAQNIRRIQDAADAIYLEGDARITLTPAPGQGGEQRLLAERVYYELATDRAVLTDVVLHTTDPRVPVPVTIRASTVRQLARGEFNAEDVKLSTSSFARPSFAVAAQRAYVRQTDTGNPALGTRTTFSARNAAVNLWGVPFLYFPFVGGSVTENGIPLRAIGMGNQDRFGFNVRTEWGLYESLGIAPPKDTDVTYRLDYFDSRGPAVGADAQYGGGFVTETTREPWNFTGDVRSYLVFDDGKDEFGGGRGAPNKNGRRVAQIDSVDRFDPFVRGHFLWEHQHFFPDDWQVQLRAGWASDPNFLEEWVPRDFYRNTPHDLSAYVKHQTNTEAITLLGTIQPNNFVTTSDMVQEQFEVERYPEIGYHRIGDSFANDNFTLFSDNTLSALRFNTSGASLEDQGYYPGLSPGIPSLGLTGTAGVPDVPESTTYRGDLRQEVDYPFTAGEFKVVPYVVGRYTGYSDSPRDSVENRALLATGFRATTAFWAVDDTAQSDLFDIHRIRHVVEPELNVFTSAQNVDRSNLFIYDEDVDAINDISAAQLALRQRWQTKRGGPGNWRSVDFFTLNVQGNAFTNTPRESDLSPASREYDVRGFRGLYFYSLPEASIPRNSINTDSTWRISDQFVILAGTEWNADEQSLATASIGAAIKQEPRVTYFIGTRYIDPLNSNITTFGTLYELSRKYTLGFSQSYDFSQANNVNSSTWVVRKFDTFVTAVGVTYDSTLDESSFQFNLYPNGIAGGFTTDQLGSAFGTRRR